jgi:hypothetical protein
MLGTYGVVLYVMVEGRGSSGFILLLWQEWEAGKCLASRLDFVVLPFRFAFGRRKISRDEEVELTGGKLIQRANWQGMPCRVQNLLHNLLEKS